MVSTYLVAQDQCLDCNNIVLKKLGTLQGVFGVEMDRIEGRITITHTDEINREVIAETLSLLGFIESKQNEDLESDEPSIWGCAL